MHREFYFESEMIHKMLTEDKFILTDLKTKLV